MRAGEIEQFAYCAHNWQLAKEGVQGKGGSEGQKYHEALGEAYQEALAFRERKLKARLVTFVSVSIALTLGVLVLAVLVLFDGYRALEMSLVGLAVVQAAAGAWTLSILAGNREEKLRRVAKSKGKVVEDDLLNESHLMEDPETGLRGRPDRLIELEGKVIPVEIKSGRTPSHPYRSHKLQVAAYCRLLESEEQEVTHGILVYPERTFRIDWDRSLQEDLFATMQKIRDSHGTVDRDHEHKARCIGCSRRHRCEQRLA